MQGFRQSFPKRIMSATLQVSSVFAASLRAFISLAPQGD
jgi:hypothetical protein